MIQGSYEPYKDKNLLQAGGSGIFGALIFGIIITAVPIFSSAWFLVSLMLGVVYTIVSVLCKLEITKNYLLIKFAPGWVANFYISILSMRAFSRLFENNVIGIGLPLASFILVGIFASINALMEKPKTTNNKLQLLSRRLNKIALTITPIVGVLGASLGMVTAKDNGVNWGLFFMGIIAYVLSLGIAYSLFDQFVKTKKQNEQY